MEMKDRFYSSSVEDLLMGIASQGYVDDMIQDIVDCVAWIYENIHDHGGNKVSLMYPQFYVPSAFSTS